MEAPSIAIDDEPSLIDSWGEISKSERDSYLGTESDDESILNGSKSEYHFHITVTPFPELVAKTLQSLHGQSDVDDYDLQSSAKDHINHCTISRVSQEGIEMWRRTSLSSSNFDDREPCRSSLSFYNRCSPMQNSRGKRAPREKARISVQNTFQTNCATSFGHKTNKNNQAC